MVLLLLIGSLLWNVLLAWATLHKPFLPPPGQPLILAATTKQKQVVTPSYF